MKHVDFDDFDVSVPDEFEDESALYEHEMSNRERERARHEERRMRAAKARKNNVEGR